MNKKHDLVVVLSRNDFDAACSQAYQQAIGVHQIDESGNSKNPHWDRSENSIKVQFISYECSGSMGGQEMVYFFKTWIE